MHGSTSDDAHDEWVGYGRLDVQGLLIEGLKMSAVLVSRLFHVG